MDPLLLFIIVCGCLVSGIRLQRYVMQVQLGSKTQIKALFTLNLIMLLIVCSYFLRALYVLSLWQLMPISYQNEFHLIDDHYPIWVPLTRCLPSIVCSLFLIYSMRYKTNDTPIQNNDNITEEKDLVDRIISTDSTSSSEFESYRQPNFQANKN